MSCNDEARFYYEQLPEVSIPIGFSNELQLLSAPITSSPRRVSIPIGFSNELQHGCYGLLMVCMRVSIPIGFSNELQPVEEAA